MNDILPQQRLLLELLVMSGDIAIAEDIKGIILERTLEECEKKGWIKRSIFGAGLANLAELIQTGMPVKVLVLNSLQTYPGLVPLGLTKQRTFVLQGNMGNMAHLSRCATTPPWPRPSCRP